jgi:hypothetical protein
MVNLLVIGGERVPERAAWYAFQRPAQGINIDLKKLYKNSVARMQAVRPKSGGFLDFAPLHPGYTLFNSTC